jgi:hypothetical protein
MCPAFRSTFSRPAAAASLCVWPVQAPPRSSSSGECVCACPHWWHVGMCPGLLVTSARRKISAMSGEIKVSRDLSGRWSWDGDEPRRLADCLSASSSRDPRQPAGHETLRWNRDPRVARGHLVCNGCGLHTGCTQFPGEVTHKKKSCTIKTSTVCFYDLPECAPDTVTAHSPTVRIWKQLDVSEAQQEHNTDRCIATPFTVHVRQGDLSRFGHDSLLEAQT